MTFGWFIAFVVLVIIEFVTVNLVTIWFAIGAIVAMISTIFTDSIIIQLGVFIVVSAISLILTKPITKMMRKKEVIPTNLDRVLGKRAEVVKKITEDEYGEVKVLGSVWTAVSDKTIDVGTKVKVKSIDGVKLIVCKEE